MTHHIAIDRTQQTQARGPAARQPARGPRGSSTAAWRLRNWRLRTKFAAVLLVPTLTALLVSGELLNEQWDTITQLDTVSSELSVNEHIADVAQALQHERDSIVSYVAGGRAGSTPTQVSATEAADRAVSSLAAAAAEAHGLGPAASGSLAQALTQLQALDAIRSSALNTREPDTAVLNSYGDLLDTLEQVTRDVAAEIGDPALSALASSAQALATSQEQSEQQTALLVDVANRKRFAAGQADLLTAALAREAASQEQFSHTADIDTRQDFQDEVSGPQVGLFAHLVHLAAVQDSLGQPVTVSAADALTTGQATAARISSVRNRVAGQMRTVIADRTNTARDSVLRGAGALLAMLVVTIVLTMFIARSILRPLRVLRRTALDIAERRLPDEVQRILSNPHTADAAQAAMAAVPIHTKEEVGQVARAFDAVHSQAVLLATGQALMRDNTKDMLVNLARRSQLLVERQLSLIDGMEQDEPDPDQLANLFELDHLATRMRRNSENLLVLAGTDVGRVLRDAPMAQELLGAAVSEVEQYARIDVKPLPEVSVVPSAAKDILHLIAELLDNATAYSDPNTRVTVQAVRTRHGELVIEIRDRGIGMSEDAVEDANSRLAEPPEVDAEVSRRMGLHVVALLARSQGVSVRLRSNEDLDGGTSAVVAVPGRLLNVTADAAATPPPSRQALPPLPRSARLAVAGRGRAREPLPADAVGAATPAGATTVRDAWASTEQATDRTEQFRPVPAGHVDPPPPAETKPDDPPTERLPIYEEVLSRWFAPTDSADREPPAALAEAPPEAGPLAVLTHPRVTSAVEHAPTTVLAVPAPRGRPTAGWVSPSDKGWQVATDIASAGTPDQVATGTGLPKRVPRAHLVPGAVTTASPDPLTAAGTPQPPSPAGSPVDAELTRRRLASYQNGVRRRGAHCIDQDETNRGDQP